MYNLTMARGFGKFLKSVGKVVKPIAHLAAPIARDLAMKGIQHLTGGGRRRRRRRRRMRGRGLVGY